MKYGSEIRRFATVAPRLDFGCIQAVALQDAAMQDTLKLKAAVRIVVIASSILFSLAAAGSMQGAMAQEHKIIAADEVKWVSAPPSIPPGAQAAVLYGDPGKEGLFVLRLKLPKGYRLAPHTHPKPEIVTVVSGTFRFGMGETADRSKAQPLGAGSFFAMPPGMAHFAFTDVETVIQLNATGPWSLTYVDPSDDPRTKFQ